MRFILLALLIFLLMNALGQKTVAFKIYDAKTNEKIDGVDISSEGIILGSSNNYGFISLKFAEGNFKIHLHLSHLAYEDSTISLQINSDTTIFCYLKTDIYLIKGVKIKTKYIESKFGFNKMTNAAFKKIPSILSEPDPLKAIQLLPGVSNAQENNTGLYVRGGNLDQTMILYDEAPLYSSMHFLGLFSTFDANAVNSITLYKSALPAKFGGRGSSILEAKLKEGDNQKHHQTLELGIIQSKVVFEGPIIKDKISYFLSGRFAYPLLLITPKTESGFKGFTNYFYDVNFKIKSDISKKHSIFLSSFVSMDNFSPGENAILGAILNKNIIQNRTGTLRWNYVINRSVFMNTTLSYSKYRNKKVPNPISSIYEQDENGINNYILKSDFEYFRTNSIKLTFGYQSLIYNGITGSRTQFKGNSVNPSPKNLGIENSIYGSTTIKKSEKHTFQIGVRLSNYSAIKPDLINYFNFEPRLAYFYKFSNNKIFSVAFDKSIQYQHLISQNLVFFPSDFWANSSKKLKPQKTYSYSLGYQFTKVKWNINSEVYYKQFKNTFDYIDGAVLQNNSDFETQLAKVNAYGYGFELEIQKTLKNDLFLNFSYTYSRSLRQSILIDNNIWYAANFDRPHMLNLFGSKQLSKKWSINALFVLQSGRPISLKLYPLLYSNRNEYRLPIYHRLDFGINYCRKPDKKRFKSTWNFSIFNVYNRLNTYGIVWDTPTQKYKSVTYFPIIPSLSYSLKIK